MKSPPVRLMERSLYPPIAEYLRDIGFQVGTELQVGEDYIDILFRKGRQRFVLEVKIAAESKSDALFLRGIVQAYRYGQNFGTANLVVIMYPYDVRGRLLEYDPEIRTRALERQVQSIVLTENWADIPKRKSLKDILSTLGAKVSEEAQAVYNVEHAARIIRESIRSLERLLNHKYKDEGEITELAQYLSQDFGLFLALSSQKAKSKKVRSQTIDLIAYILMNQILFYFIYQRRALGNKLQAMQKIQHPQELIQYFKAIRLVDFAPIFDIEVASKIPPDADIVRHINDTIDCLLEALRIDRLSNDIYGRLIGKSLPTETREVLASYYTKTPPARLLAGLTISKPYETVWDAACGSGTLLVSAYERKKTLYQRANNGLESDEDLANLHTRFIERDLTGTDIMPFACHLASLNLAAQNLATPTDSMRICFKNSLSIDKLPVQVEEAYGNVYRELSRVSLTQQTLQSFDEEKPAQPKPKMIELKEVDCVLINPPFTRSSRVPAAMKTMLQKSPHTRFLGNTRMPLWAHFLGLTERILVGGGKLGAIIPISLLHGKDTQKLRQFYLRNYTIEYLVKPSAGDSFSEDSDYGDMIIVAKRTPPPPGSKVRFVLLKNPVKETSLVDMDNVVRTISLAYDSRIDNDDYFSYETEQSKLIPDIENLMPYVFTSNSKLFDALHHVMGVIQKADTTRFLRAREVQKGYQFRPKNKARTSLFIRHLSDRRIQSADQFFDSEQKVSDKLTYYSKSSPNREPSFIPLTNLTKTFRSIASVRQMNITDTYDYVLSKEARSKSQGARLFLAHRFRLNSPETFGLAFYSADPIVTTEAVTMVKCKDQDAKILCLYFNSVFHVMQLMMLSKQSTYGFIEMTALDWGKAQIPSLDKLSGEDKEAMLAMFSEISEKSLDSVTNQLKDAPDYRIELDLLVSKILKLNIGRPELLEIYKDLSDELRHMSQKDEE